MTCLGVPGEVNTEGAIENGQSRETGNIGNTRRRKSKQKHNKLIDNPTNNWRLFQRLVVY
jgi:hypothetical protein